MTEQNKPRKKKNDKISRPSNNSSNPRKTEDDKVLIAERDRIKHRIKDSTPNQVENNSDDIEPPKINSRKKLKRGKKIKKKLVKSNIDEDVNSNSVNSQNKDYINDDKKDPPPLAIPRNVKDKLKHQINLNEQANRKTTTKSKNSKNSQQIVEINSTKTTKKIKKKKKAKRPLKKKIEKSEANPENDNNNNNENLKNSPKRSIKRVILRGGISNKEPIIKSESSDEEESASSSNKVINKVKVPNHVNIRPSSSASSTKSLGQKHKDASSRGKNYSDTSNNSNAIKKSSSSTSSKKIQIIKDDYDEKIDSTIDEEEEDLNNNYTQKRKNDEISNHDNNHILELSNHQPSRKNENEEERSAEYENEEEEEEEEDDNEIPFEKEKINKIGSGNSGYNKLKYDQVSDYYSNSNDDIRKEILSPIRGNDHRSLSDGTFKNINHDTLSISGIIGSIGSQSGDDYSYNSSTSSKKQGIIRKGRKGDFIITGKNNRLQKDDIIRNKKEFNRRNSDPTLDFLEFNDASSNGIKKVNFDNFNDQNNKRAKNFNINMNINMNRNPNRHQSVRIQKINELNNNNNLNNNKNFIRSSGSNVINNKNDIAQFNFPKFTPKPINFHLQNYTNAKFPINDDEFHDFEQTSKKKIDLSPPINFQIQIIPNPPIIAIDAELEVYNRDKLLKEIKRQQ